MYVSTMDEGEVLREYLTDEKWIIRVYVNWNHPKTQALVAKARKMKRKRLTEATIERTKNGNRVIIIRTVDLTDLSVGIYHVGIVPCSDDTIMYAMTLTNQKLAFFTPHFFERYKERMGEQGVKIKDPVRDYFGRNPELLSDPGDNPRFKNALQYTVRDGVMLGNLRGNVTLGYGDGRTVVWELYDVRTFLHRDAKMSQRIEFIDNEARKRL